MLYKEKEAKGENIDKKNALFYIPAGYTSFSNAYSDAVKLFGALEGELKGDSELHDSVGMWFTHVNTIENQQVIIIFLCSQSPCIPL